MLATLDNIRQIAQLCREGEPLPAALTRWLATSLQQYLEHRVHSMDDAFGIRGARGGVPPWLEAGMRVRNAALRDLAERFCAAPSLTRRAAQVRTLALRYGASRWQTDQALDELPPDAEGTARALLWRAFKSKAKMPLGDRQLRKILGP